MADLFSYLLTCLSYFKIHFHLMDTYSSLFIEISTKLCQGYRKGRWVDLFPDIYVNQ